MTELHKFDKIDVKLSKEFKLNFVEQIFCGRGSSNIASNQFLSFHILLLISESEKILISQKFLWSKKFY